MVMSEAIAYLQDKVWLLVILLVAAGYLFGSISFARIIHYFVKKTGSIDAFAEPVPHSDETFESSLVSATLVTKKLGARYGLTVSLLDMLKVALPALVVRLLLKDDPWYLIIALAGVIGHNYPVWYRFVGGRGESPIIGSVLVINWFSLFLANGAGLVLGYITGSVLVVRWSYHILLPVWFLIYFNNPWPAAYMVATNFLFWMSMRADLARFQDLKKKKGLKFSEEDVSEFILMGRSLGRFLDRYSIYALAKKALSK
jgi:acyl phosphate:glycerol-3-phosphate acyltransferase